VAGKEQQIAYDRVKVMLCATVERIANAPAQERLSRQLSLILCSPQPPLSKAMQVGHELVEAGLHDAASQLYKRLCEVFPNGPQGLAGLAFLAMQKKEWSEALTRWDELIERFPASSAPNWHLSRGQALAQLNRRGEAEEELRYLVRSNPDLLAGWSNLLEVLSAQGKWEAAMRVLESSPCAKNDLPVFIRLRFDILLGLRRLDEARAEFSQILHKDADVPVLLELFKYAPILIGRCERTGVFLALMEKLENSEPSPDIRGLRARIFLALRDYRQFLLAVDKAGEGSLGNFEQQLRAVANRLREQSFPDYDAPKFFGIGLSRTGTTSLTAALSALNFRAIHWLNPLTNEMMRGDDVHLFDAFTDTPVCVDFESYYFMFHNSKFIYTVRPFESWQRSMTAYFRKRFGTGDFRKLRNVMRLSDKLPYREDFSSVHLALYFNHKNYEAAYRAYDSRVRRFFRDKRKDRFLEFDVSSGRWEDLCRFTDTSVPSIDFPWLNRSLR
jgi:tetratricopeptide (TPR) repeat protein